MVLKLLSFFHLQWDVFYDNAFKKLNPGSAARLSCPLVGVRPAALRRFLSEGLLLSSGF
jgi:hypothetical protein